MDICKEDPIQSTNWGSTVVLKSIDLKYSILASIIFPDEIEGPKRNYKSTKLITLTVRYTLYN